MPLYDYKCAKCGTIREIRHGFEESYDEPCPACGAAMSRVFNPAPIVFKGAGFYVTDSRSKNGSGPDASAAKAEPAPSANRPPNACPQRKPVGWSSASRLPRRSFLWQPARSGCCAPIANSNARSRESSKRSVLRLIRCVLRPQFRDSRAAPKGPANYSCARNAHWRRSAEPSDSLRSPRA
jgi:putative FmdB family regulatory protein